MSAQKAGREGLGFRAAPYDDEAFDSDQASLVSESRPGEESVVAAKGHEGAVGLTGT